MCGVRLTIIPTETQQYPLLFSVLDVDVAKKYKRIEYCHGNVKMGSLCTTKIQCVPLATEPGNSLIILPLMRILQRNLKRTYLVV